MSRHFFFFQMRLVFPLLPQMSHSIGGKQRKMNQHFCQRKGAYQVRSWPTQKSLMSHRKIQVARAKRWVPERGDDGWVEVACWHPWKGKRWQRASNTGATGKGVCLPKGVQAPARFRKSAMFEGGSSKVKGWFQFRFRHPLCSSNFR